MPNINAIEPTLTDDDLLATAEPASPAVAARGVDDVIGDGPDKQTSDPMDAEKVEASNRNASDAGLSPGMVARKEVSVRQESYTEPSDREIAARDEAAKAGADLVANQQRLGEAQVEVARAEAQAAEERERMARDAEVTRQAIVALQNEEIDKARAQRQSLLERYLNTPDRDYWADKTTGQRIAAKVGIMMGVLGGALANQKNLALESVKEDIERDVQIKRAQREKLWRAVEMSNGMVSEAIRRKAEALGDDESVRAAGTARALAQLERMRAAAGMTRAQIESDGAVIALRQKLARERAEIEAKDARRVIERTNTIAGRPGTGGPTQKQLADQAAARAREERAEKDLSLRMGAAARALANQALNTLGFKESQVVNREFNRLAEQLSRRNAALDVMAAGTFIKQAQGGTGVISDSDRVQFWERIGAIGVRTEDQITQALKGELGEDKRAIVSNAVRWLADEAKKNLGKVRSGLEWAFDNDPDLSSRKSQMLGVFFPEARKASSAPKPAAKPANAKLDAEDLAAAREIRARLAKDPKDKEALQAWEILKRKRGK